MSFTRRSFLTTGVAAGAAALTGINECGDGSGSGDSECSSRGCDTKSGLFFGYTPFTQDLCIPAVLKDLGVGALGSGGAMGHLTPDQVSSRGPILPTGRCDDVAHGIAPEFGLGPSDWNQTGVGTTHASEFLLITEETTHSFVPSGPEVPVFSYRDGTQTKQSIMNARAALPGPTVFVDYLGPAVLRNCNLLTHDRPDTNSTGHDHETSIHLHGTHAPAHSDGYPDFYVLGGEARDYFYPNVAPRVTDPATNIAPVDHGPFDETWIPSTLWYHDHGMDVTGFNVSRGLAGFYLVVDGRERQLEAMGVIPTIGGPQDIGLALQDQRFNADGSIFYDFLDHNGRLGDVFTVNGRVQPRLKVERRKYRFRFLNASSARIYQIRLSTRQKMCIIGTDSWLLPRAIEVESFQLNQGQRHDVIIDFRDAPDEVFVENIMLQTDGRKAKEVDPRKQRDLLIKFEVMPGSVGVETECRDGTVIRGLAGIDTDGQWTPIRESEIVETRRFRFDRSNGAWTVNNRFFNPRRADAVPELGVGAERWFFENSSGGWWHPIHTHLEGFQIQAINGRLPARERRFNSDLVQLEGGDAAEVFMKFRTFTGPFAFHCHNIEHEDMRMMGAHNTTEGTLTPLVPAPELDGEEEIPHDISGVVSSCEELEHDERLFFERAGDLEILEGRGVGEACEFDMDRRGNRGRED